MRVVLKCVLMVYGDLSVILDLVQLMLMLCVDNYNTHVEVQYINHQNLVMAIWTNFMLDVMDM
jgi:hypothetical protein